MENRSSVLCSDAAFALSCGDVTLVRSSVLVADFDIVAQR